MPHFFYFYFYDQKPNIECKTAHQSYDRIWARSMSVLAPLVDLNSPVYEIEEDIEASLNIRRKPDLTTAWLNYKIACQLYTV